MFLSGLIVYSAAINSPFVLHRVFFQQIKDVHYRFLQRLPTPTEVGSSVWKFSPSLNSVVV